MCQVPSRFEKMNINFVYTLVTSLTFTVVFDVNDSQKQNYFIFDGEEATAHLFRENHTMTLYLSDRDNNAIYQTSNINSTFIFSWVGYQINNMYMNKTSYNGSLGSLEFDGFTFLSPHMEILDTCVISEPYPGPLFHECERTRYGLVTLIVLGIGLLLKFDTISPKLRALIREVCTEVPLDESIYVEMDSVEEVYK